MDLLNLFLSHTKLNLNEMIQLSGIPKTSVHRMVGSLEDMGFLQRDHEGKYALGLVFLQFGNLVAERLDIRNIALPIMRELRERVGEAVHLVVKDGRESIYIEKLDTDHPVRLYTKIGRRSPLYAGACSRILLAFMDETEREQYLSEVELLPIGNGTITAKEKLRAVLETSRKKGYSFSLSELENYTAELAAPIFDHNGRLTAGISVAGPEVRFHKDRLPELAEDVMRAANEISHMLGWIEPVAGSTAG